LFLLSVETKEFTPLTNPSPEWAGDTNPAISYDGRTLLFTRQTSFAVNEIDRLNLSADLKPVGQPVKLQIKERLPRRPAWIPGGKEFLFMAEGGIWRMPAFGGGHAVRVETFGRDDGTPALSPRGDRLAVSHAIADANIWRLDLQEKDGKPRRLIDSTAREAFPQYSPDGRRIVFYSDRSGSLQIWICDPDGTRAFPLTSFTGATGTPRWSPDGQTISFDSNTSGQWNVYTVSADGGRPRKMMSSVGTSSNYAASWSHDGRWLYFTSNRSGEAQVWKMPSQGGEALKVTTNGGVAPLESPDGTTLYYTKDMGTGSIWKMPVGGGTETQLVHSLYRFNYAVTGAGLYFVPRPGKEGTTSVQFFDFASGALKTIIETGYPDLGLAISLDGRYLLFEQIDYAASDLMLIEGFH
jgi:Tol biopolymer transport system component